MVPLQNLKFRFLKDDHKVYLLTAGDKSVRKTFSSTRYHTWPYKSRNNPIDTFNVVLGYTKKHNCDLAKLSTTPQELDSAVTCINLGEAKHVAACLHMPLIVLLSPDDHQHSGDDQEQQKESVDRPELEAYYFDPRAIQKSNHAFSPVPDNGGGKPPLATLG